MVKVADRYLELVVGWVSMSNMAFSLRIGSGLDLNADEIYE
jgi:hypothetical protein